MQNCDNQHIVITIGRQFGSGGRELGRCLAQKMGIAYYDKELLQRVAEGAGVDEEFVRDNDERVPRLMGAALSFNMGFAGMSWYQTPNSISGESLYRSQSDVIHKVVEQESAVIVGRSADYVLRDHPRAVHVFVHAPMEVCIKRIMSRNESLTAEKARQLAEKTNRLRANFYNFYTDKRWGEARSYDLAFDTSLLATEDIADIIIEYVRKRFKIE
jgi:cytidylate kinase